MVEQGFEPKWYDQMKLNEIHLALNIGSLTEDDGVNLCFKGFVQFNISHYIMSVSCEGGKIGLWWAKLLESLILKPSLYTGYCNKVLKVLDSSIFCLQITSSVKPRVVF